MIRFVYARFFVSLAVAIVLWCVPPATGTDAPPEAAISPACLPAGIVLHAQDALVRGETLRYEPEANKDCLGFWTNPADWAEWDFIVKDPGLFEIEVWQGCGKGQGGSEVQIEVADEQIPFVVVDTGHFQNFLPRKLGRVFLDSGAHSLSLKPQSLKKGAVMDVRLVRLVPVAAAERKEKTPDTIRTFLEARRVLFLGDSITYGGQYVEMVESYLRMRFPSGLFECLNIGLPSETVSGLTEPGHAGGRFPRPDLHERLERALQLLQPDLIIACYGMNDGIYHPLSEDRFRRFREGIELLRRRAEEAGAEILHLTPPVFDAHPLKGKTLPAGLSEYEQPYAGYDEVLTRYSNWLLSQRTNGWQVIDVHGPMAAFLKKSQAASPGFRLAKDGVHPTRQGHWIIAREILRYLGAPESLVSQETADAMDALHPRAGDMVELIGKRHQLLRDAWLAEVGHKRPGMAAGVPVAEAEAQARTWTAQLHRLLFLELSPGSSAGSQDAD